MTHNKDMPPNYYNNFLGKFKLLTRLNVYGSMVDDTAYRAIGETCDKLVELNAGGTWITNMGIKYLSLDDAIILCFSTK